MGRLLAPSIAAFRAAVTADKLAPMIEVLVTEDPVRISFLRQVLEAADIPVFVTEPGPWNGPCRLLVPAEDAELARRAIAEAEAALSGVN
jgi:hypothetical protein